jgi:hypothetical protein
LKNQNKRNPIAAPAIAQPMPMPTASPEETVALWECAPVAEDEGPEVEIELIVCGVEGIDVAEAEMEAVTEVVSGAREVVIVAVPVNGKVVEAESVPVAAGEASGAPAGLDSVPKKRSAPFVPSDICWPKVVNLDPGDKVWSSSKTSPSPDLT